MRAEDWWWGTAAVLIATFAVTLFVWAIDPRQIDGTSVWAKPMKFQLSLALHFATLALIVSCLGENWRSGDALRWVAVAAVACTAFEVGYIMVQAARAQPSHFNVATPTLAALYAAMAIGTVVITVAAGVVGLAAWADGAARLGPATRLGVVLGLIGGTVLTLVVAFRMGGALTHHVGVELPGAPRMPLTGWSLTVGDRRVPHFFATHMMQAVPLVGFAADGLSARLAALPLTAVAACAWIMVTLVLFNQANSGRPIIG